MYFYAPKIHIHGDYTSYIGEHLIIFYAEEKLCFTVAESTDIVGPKLTKAQGHYSASCKSVFEFFNLPKLEGKTKDQKSQGVNIPYTIEFIHGRYCACIKTSILLETINEYKT